MSPQRTHRKKYLLELVLSPFYLNSELLSVSNGIAVQGAKSGRTCCLEVKLEVLDSCKLLSNYPEPDSTGKLFTGCWRVVKVWKNSIQPN